MKRYIVIILVFMCQTVSAQTKGNSAFMIKNPTLLKLNVDSIFMLSDTVGVFGHHSNYLLIGINYTSCKSKMYVIGKIGKSSKSGLQNTVGTPVKKNMPAALIRVHGSVMYDGFYQSNIDTPYLNKNISQHTVQAGLDITVKDRYPIRLYFATRFSNDMFIKNITDLNLGYGSSAFRNQIYAKAEKWIEKQALVDSLGKLDSLITVEKRKADSMRNSMSAAALLQRLVEQRERAWFQSKMPNNTGDTAVKRYDSLTQNQAAQLKNWGNLQRKFRSDSSILLYKNKYGSFKDSLNDSSQEKKMHRADSSATARQDSILAKRKKADSLQHRIDSLERLYRADKNKLDSLRDSVLNKISRIKDPNELALALKDMHLPDSVLPQGYKKLLALQSFSLGRSSLNYSELTVQNVSVEGVQADYSPSWSIAFAGGTVNYRFRDFVLNENAQQQQYIVAVRAGKGKKDGNHFFITYYTGKRQLYNYSTDSAGNLLPGSPGYNLMGISLEKRWQLNKTTSIVAEVAKSSAPWYTGQAAKPALVASTFSFGDRSNEAYSVKFATLLQHTQTKIDAYYKQLGANFQSFSTFTTSAHQRIWSIKVVQPFFKRQLVITVSLKENDFTNPFINQQFNSNIIFKSISATLRKKKWPVISLGYSPSSQLTSLGSNQLTVSTYYTMVGTASYAYKYHGVLMNSMLSYTRFYNNAADSGFAYFNTQNLMVSQNIFLKKFTFQVDLSVAENSYYNLYTAGGNVQYKIFKWLTVGGGVKYNVQTAPNNLQVGYGGNTTIRINKMGDIQFLAEKTYIPGMSMQLVENTVGRLTYYKKF